VTDEPVVAYVSWVGSLRTLVLARRSPSGWMLSTLDTVSLSLRRPSLALSPSGAARLALTHHRGLDGDGPGTYFGEAATPDGPVAWTRVDETGNAWASLALDPVSGEPRIAYTANTRLLRYAWRAAGNWTPMTVNQNSEESFPTVPSLILNNAGDPLIVQTRNFLFEPQPEPASRRGGPAVASCPSNLSPPRVVHFDRVGAEGAGPFTSNIVSGGETRSSASAVASFVGNESRVVWRHPDGYASSPCVQRIIYSTRAATLGVPTLEPPAIGLAIGPNPLRGGTVGVAFRLSREAEVTLELFDIAGRRVARSTTRQGSGVRSLSWSPGDISPGVYRLVARVPDGEIGRASLVVLR
jgi:hypothetical protein